MAETTTGTGMYSVAPTVLPKQGESPHEVLAKQSAQAQKAKAMAAAQDAKKRETAMANAASTMERINVENWKTDSNYFNRRRTSMTDEYAKILNRTNGNPTTEDMAPLEDAANQYESESNYSLQSKDEYADISKIIMNKGDQYTPESIEAVTNFYALPFEERMIATKIPKLQFTQEIEKWETGFYDWLDGIDPLSPYSGGGYDPITGLTTTSSGKRFNEKDFRATAENRYDLGVGVVNPETGEEGEPAITSIAFMIDDVLAKHKSELADINDPALKEEAKKKIVIDWMVTEAKSRHAAGQTAYRVSGGKSLDDKPPLYNPSAPKTTGKITFDGTSHPFIDTYTVGVNESAGDAKMISVTDWYTKEKGSEKGDLIELKDGVQIFELTDGTKYMKAKVGIKHKTDAKSVRGVETTIVPETRVIEITPDIDKSLRKSSDEYRERMEYYETQGAQASSGGTSR